VNIKEISNLTSISCYTIRYYEKIGLLHPQRGTNKYRVYSDIDIFILKMIAVLQYSNFDLKSIGTIAQSLLFQNPSEDCNRKVNQLFDNKINELESMVIHYEMIISLLKKVPLTATSAEFHLNKVEIQKTIIDMIENIYSQIKEKKEWKNI
jgi:MerR family transcriptional regulator, Zn(II)-responsive regulator of zntA